MVSKPITVWHRFNEKEGKWDFNHIEDGHIDTDQYLKPLGNKEQTVNWSKGTWMHRSKYLKDNVVVDRP